MFLSRWHHGFCPINKSYFYFITYRQQATYHQNEQWKEIKEFPNYHVSSFGGIKNIKTNKTRYINYDRFRETRSRPQIFLYDGPKYQNLYVARLILSTFKPHPNSSQLEVNHIDGDP